MNIAPELLPHLLDAGQTWSQYKTERQKKQLAANCRRAAILRQNIAHVARLAPSPMRQLTLHDLHQSLARLAEQRAGAAGDTQAMMPVGRPAIGTRVVNTTKF